MNCRRTLLRARSLLALSVIAAASVTSVLETSAQATTQVSGPGQFSVSPARRILFAQPPVDLVPATVSNTTDVPFRVRVFPVVLHQPLPGAFTFNETPRSLNAAHNALPLTPASFTLMPGQRQVVDLHWQQLLLPRANHAYIGVVFQGRPQMRTRQPVNVVDRLLSLNFLQLPGHYISKGRFTALRAQQGPNQIQLRARIKNIGQIVQSPSHGRVAVRDATGRVVYRDSWACDVVIPRAQRDCIIPLNTDLPRGSYQAATTMRFGDTRRARTVTRFRLVATNKLAAPATALENVQATGTIGESASITGDVRSVGTESASTTVKVALFSTSGGFPTKTPLATSQTAFTALAPQSQRHLSVNLGKLNKGSYRVVVTYTAAPGSTKTLVQDFVATPPRDTSIWKFLRDHAVLIGLVLAILALTALAAFAARRQRALKAQLAALQAQAALAEPPVEVRAGPEHRETSPPTGREL